MRTKNLTCEQSCDKDCDDTIYYPTLMTENLDVDAICSQQSKFSGPEDGYLVAEVRKQSGYYKITNDPSRNYMFKLQQTMGQFNQTPLTVEDYCRFRVMNDIAVVHVVVSHSEVLKMVQSPTALLPDRLATFGIKSLLTTHLVVEVVIFDMSSFRRKFGVVYRNEHFEYDWSGLLGAENFHQNSHESKKWTQDVISVEQNMTKNPSFIECYPHASMDKKGRKTPSKILIWRSNVSLYDRLTEPMFAFWVWPFSWHDVWFLTHSSNDDILLKTTAKTLNWNETRSCSRKNFKRFTF